jgi:hypothetical protein
VEKVTEKIQIKLFKKGAVYYEKGVCGYGSRVGVWRGVGGFGGV